MQNKETYFKSIHKKRVLSASLSKTCCWKVCSDVQAQYCFLGQHVFMFDEGTINKNSCVKEITTSFFFVRNCGGLFTTITDAAKDQWPNEEDMQSAGELITEQSHHKPLLLV